MPYDRPHMLLSWGGSIVNRTSNEVMQDFAGSMRFASTTVAASIVELPAVDNDDALDQLVDKLRAWWGNENAWVPPQYVIGWVKWNRCDVEGHYVDKTSTRMQEGLTIPGGGGFRHPLFISAAVSWTTGARRGPAHMGRTYMPTGAPVEDGTGRIRPLEQGLMAQAAANFIASAGNWEGLDTTSVTPHVMSRVRGGASRAITGVRIGSEFDVQQRRKRQPEDYVVVPVT